MKKIIIVQISLLLVISGAFGGMLVYTDVYSDIKSTIVDILCLSCIKMDPISQLDFTFETSNNQLHPEFVLDNLTSGVVFLAFRKDVCAGCDTMDPIIQDIFNVNFEKEDLYYESVEYNDNIVNFFHINLDHSSGDLKNSFFTYDKDSRSGVPMFVIITLGDNNRIIEPYYTTAYGTLGLNENIDREDFLRIMISSGIDYYNEYKTS